VCTASRSAHFDILFWILTAFQVIAAQIDVIVFRFMIPCSQVNGYRRFGGTYYFRLQRRFECDCLVNEVDVKAALGMPNTKQGCHALCRYTNHSVRCVVGSEVKFFTFDNRRLWHVQKPDAWRHGVFWSRITMQLDTATLCVINGGMYVGCLASAGGFLAPIGTAHLRDACNLYRGLEMQMSNHSRSKTSQLCIKIQSVPRSKQSRLQKPVV
jgi:hypothetical protein